MRELRLMSAYQIFYKIEWSEGAGEKRNFFCSLTPLRPLVIYTKRNIAANNHVLDTH
jgi:hypothetical protein